jgi:DNA-binding NtrC family response regulator
MSEASSASSGPREPRSNVVLLCSDPRSPRIVAALQVLRKLAVTIVGSGEQASDLLTHTDADVVIAEEWVGTADGRQLLAWAIQTRPFAVGVLLASSRGGASSASRDGLIVLPKLVDAETLNSVCSLALDCAALRRRLGRFELDQTERLPALRHVGHEDGEGIERYEGLLVFGAPMREVVQTLRGIEDSDVTVQIQGETGTGKELVARAIHARSRRRRGPFLPINLGTIPDGLRESELFGHVRGAFTGAEGTRGGLFSGADGGTLFLDEVGDATPALQLALLRVLEEGMITPVGADRPRRVNVRIISATNQNLAERVRQHRFRRDLYYRLNVFTLRLPPLRDRVDDVIPLANHFLRQAGRPLVLSADARRALKAHRWEGNVRELRSVMERAALVCKGREVGVAELSLPRDVEESAPPQTIADSFPSGATLRDLEREILQKTLRLADGNQSQAARILGLHESTLRFRMRRAGIVPSRRASGS